MSYGWNATFESTPTLCLPYPESGDVGVGWSRIPYLPCDRTPTRGRERLGEHGNGQSTHVRQHEEHEPSRVHPSLPSSDQGYTVISSTKCLSWEGYLYV